MAIINRDLTENDIYDEYKLFKRIYLGNTYYKIIFVMPEEKKQAYKFINDFYSDSESVQKYTNQVNSWFTYNYNGSQVKYIFVDIGTDKIVFTYSSNVNRINDYKYIKNVLIEDIKSKELRAKILK